ncbi:glycerophosphodiester phosphodiesterase [Tessaracoccus caeni]|uniref:glycerophosphodiester phosphodiesterase n=1 Tax=Tessaracoccus caeni TaxID=3031239 RepID=UPI0023DC8E8F|nr:glycerophosphodiester phosphodiesterase [Tessaracoccus caeni]MDF1489375.1 glycerophosphodiester phosphodiesterase [Tessaracoccus caeni]
MTEIWAHRGATEFAPENTLSAFAKAIQLGAKGTELDVQRTRDGELVVIHDETVDRTSNGSGAIADLTFDEVRALDFSNGYADHAGVQIPTLREVLELLVPTNLQLNVELKDSIELYPGMGHQVADLVDEVGMTERVLYSSFNHVSIAGLRDRIPAAQLALLYEGMLHKPWAYARTVGAGAIHPVGFALQHPDLVRRCHDTGIAVRTWTINDPRHIVAMAEMGIDAIITDFPDRALEALEGR